MREIKFRAWDTRFNNMHYYADVKTWHLNMPDLEECTLMQYTGLKDKNGKEIYEDDIVTCYDTAGGEVYNHRVDFYGFRQEIWSEEFDGKTKVLIIGNIYENPELLQANLPI